MKHLLALLLGVFILGIAAGVFIARGQPPDWDNSRPLVKTLRCSDGNQDLGQVWHTDRFGVEFHLVNGHREHTFEIGPLRGGCLCAKVEPENLKLEPGQSAIVKATVDLEGGLSGEALPREFAETILAPTKGKWGEDIVLRMSARAVVRASYRLAPDTMPFGTVIRGDRPQRRIEIECLASDAVEALEVVSAPEWTEAAVKPSPDNAKAFRLTAGVRPDAPYGRLTGRVRFRARLASGWFVTRSAPVRAVVLDDLQPVPSSVLFAVTGAGDERTVSITLQSYRGERFVVADVKPSSPALKAARQEGGSGTSHRYIITIRPESAGFLDERVGFALRTEAGREHVAEVKVRGYVLSARAG